MIKLNANIPGSSLTPFTKSPTDLSAGSDHQIKAKILITDMDNDDNVISEEDENILSTGENNDTIVYSSQYKTIQSKRNSPSQKTAEMIESKSESKDQMDGELPKQI